MNYITGVSEIQKGSSGVNVSVAGKQLTLQALTPNEIIAFDTELPKLVNNILTNRDIKNLFEANIDFLLYSLNKAKEQFSGDTFAGINARSNEFGFSTIRPEHFGFTTWDGNNTGTGWGDWVGTVAAPVTLGEEVMIVPLGLQNFDPSPKTSAIKAVIGNTTFPVWYFEQSQRIAASTRIWELPKKFSIEPRSQFSIRKKRDAVGTDSLAFAGIVFAQGSTLILESPTLATPAALVAPNV